MGRASAVSRSCLIQTETSQPSYVFCRALDAEMWRHKTNDPLALERDLLKLVPELTNKREECHAPVVLRTIWSRSEHAAAEADQPFTDHLQWIFK